MIKATCEAIFDQSERMHLYSYQTHCTQQQLVLWPGNSTKFSIEYFQRLLRLVPKQHILKQAMYLPRFQQSLTFWKTIEYVLTRKHCLPELRVVLFSRLLLNKSSYGRQHQPGVITANVEENNNFSYYLMCPQMTFVGLVNSLILFRWRPFNSSRQFS